MTDTNIRYTFKKNFMVFGRKLITLCFLIYAFMCAIMFFAQDILLFHPESGPFPPPQAATLHDYKAVFMNSNDHKLGFLFSPPKPSMPIIVVFHGNAGTAVDTGWSMQHYVDRGWGVILAEYSGWTGNEGGPPSEQSMRQDALAYADWILKEYPENPIVAWGFSLGTNAAAGMASERPVIAVVLESPYTSILGIAQERYFWLPASIILKNPLNSMVLLPKISAPVAVITGEHDTVVPSWMGHEVWRNIRVKGLGLFVTNAAHMPTLIGDVGMKPRELIYDFLDSVRTGQFLPHNTDIYLP